LRFVVWRGSNANDRDERHPVAYFQAFYFHLSLSFGAADYQLRHARARGLAA
jgi:hypothetical protein